jgi:hypothetical protein
MRGIVALLAFSTLSATAFAGENCMCVYKGGRVMEGEVACISTVDGPELARCGKFLNNTSWIRLGKQCTPAKTTENPQKSAKIQVAEVSP